MALLYLHNLAIDSCPLRLYVGYLIGIASILKFEDILSKKNRNLPIVFLSLEPSLIDKFNQPLNHREYIIDIQSLQLKRLEGIRAFHINEGITDLF